MGFDQGSSMQVTRNLHRVTYHRQPPNKLLKLPQKNASTFTVSEDLDQGFSVSDFFKSHRH